MNKLERQISEILYWCWDPLDLVKTHSNRKKYDVYVDDVLAVITGNSRRELTEYLNFTCKEMGATVLHARSWAATGFIFRAKGNNFE